MTDQQTFDLNSLCKERTFYGIPEPVTPMLLLENVYNYSSFHDAFEALVAKENLLTQVDKNNIIASMLLQVYLADNMMINMLNIAHNDLHAENILVEILDRDVTLDFYVVGEDKTGQKNKIKVSLVTNVLIRIIDLGLASFKVNDDTFGLYMRKTGLMFPVESYSPIHKSMWKSKEGKEGWLLLQCRKAVGDVQVDNLPVLYTKSPPYVFPVSNENIFMYSLLSLQKYMETFKKPFSSNRLVWELLGLMNLSALQESVGVLGSRYLTSYNVTFDSAIQGIKYDDVKNSLHQGSK